MGMNFKRFLSLLLALVMVLGMFPMGHVHAEENGNTINLTVGGNSHTITVNGDVSGEYLNDYVTVATNYAAEYTEKAVGPVDSIVSGGKYLIVNNNAAKTMTNVPGTQNAYAGDMNGMALDGTIANYAATAIWTFTGSDGQYTIQDANQMYLCVAANNVTLAESGSALRVERNGDNWVIGSSDTCWLNNAAGKHNVISAWNDNGAKTDGGSQFKLYKIESVPAYAASETAATALAEGKSYLIANTSTNAKNHLLRSVASSNANFLAVNNTLTRTNFDSTAIWTLGEDSDESAAFVGKVESAAGGYLSFMSSKSGIVGEADAPDVTILENHTNKADDTWRIVCNGSYLNPQSGQAKTYGGPGDNSQANTDPNQDNGNHWFFYEVFAVGTTTITFTAKTAGTTDITIGDTTYHIVVTDATVDPDPSLPVEPEVPEWPELRVIARYTSNRLSWEAVEGTAYTVQYSADGEAWTDLDTASGNDIHDTGAVGTRYFYRLAVDGNYSEAVQGAVTGMEALLAGATHYKVYENGIAITNGLNANGEKEIFADGDDVAKLNALESGTIIYKANSTNLNNKRAVLGTDSDCFVGTDGNKFRHEVGNGLAGTPDHTLSGSGVDFAAGFIYEYSTGRWVLASEGRSKFVNLFDRRENFRLLAKSNALVYYVGTATDNSGTVTKPFTGTIYSIIVTGEVLTEAELRAVTCGHVYDSCEDTVCNNCGFVREALNHTWDNGAVTTEPTLEAEGVKTYTCSVCGGTKTESIAKLEPGLSVQPLMEGWTHGTVSLADCEYTFTKNGYAGYSVCHGGNYYVNANDGTPQSNVLFNTLTVDHQNNKIKFMKNGSLFMYYNEGKPYWGKVSSVTGNETDGTGLFYVLKANPNGTFEGFSGYDVITSKYDIVSGDSYLIAANFGDEWFIMYPSTEAVSIAKVVNVAATHKHDEGKTTCSCGHAHIGGESQDTHKLTHVEAKDPTCTEPGNIEYWHCSECDGYWKDEACTVSVSKDVVTISAYGHSYEASVTAPTCTEKGYTTYTCRRCNDTYTSAEVAAKGHGTTVHVEAKDATCTEAGNFEHWYCADCGAAWLDVERTQPTTAEETVISALGHSWDRNNEDWAVAYTCRFCEEATNPNYSTVVYFDNTETQLKTVEAYFYGVNSGGCWAVSRGEENGIYTFLIHKDAKKIMFMDDNNGADTIMTRQFEVVNGATYTGNVVAVYFQSHSSWDDLYVTGIDAEGNELTFAKNGDLENGKYVMYVDKDAVKMVAVFMTVDGDEVGDVEFDVVEGKTYFYPACDHSYNNGEVTKAPTCTETGIKTFTCSICGETKTESIPATHDAITHVEAKDATCTEAGNFEHWYCADCGAAWLDAERTQPTTAAETVIPALGHCWDRENAGKCAIHYSCCKCSKATNPNFNIVVRFDNTETQWDTVKAFWSGNGIQGWAVSQGVENGKHTFLIYKDAVSIDFRNGSSGSETITTRTFEVENNKTYDANLFVIYFQENSAWDKITVTGATDESYDTILSNSISETPKDGKHVLYMDEDASVMMATFYLGDTFVYRCQFDVVEGKTYFYPECNHAYDDGAVTKAPTCTETGIKTFTCSICGDSYTDSIPATGNHTPGEPVEENKTAAGYYEVVYCSVCKTHEISREYVDLLADKVVMVSKNVELKSEIQMVYTVKIPASLIDSGAYVVMAKTGAYGEVTKTYTAAELKAGENKVYMGVAPAEITAPISITVYDGNDVAQDLYNRSGVKLDDASRTVAGYAVELLEDEDSTSKLKDLAVALLTYGGYAQEYFGVNTEKSAFDLLDKVPDLSNITAETLKDYKNTQTNANMGVKATTIATYVDSNIRIRVYLAVEDDINAYTFKLTVPVGNEVVEKSVEPGYDQASGRYYVDITEIASAYIDFEYQITITGDNGTNVITASVLAYARSVLSKSTDEKLLNLAKALYLYNQAANAYYGV